MDASSIPAWLGLITQTSRFLTLDLPAAEGLYLAGLHGVEGVNHAPRFELECVSASAFLDVGAWLGEPVAFALATAERGRRYWQGFVTQATALGADGGLAHYRLVVESALAFLALRRNTLIFQDRTALQVIGQVFADHPRLKWRSEVTVPLRQRPITTQYREDDAAFVRRLLGEEGLSFRFEHAPDGGADAAATLVLFDPPASQSLPAGAPATLRFHRIDASEASDAISAFSEHRDVVPDTLATVSWAPDQVRGVAAEARAAAPAGAPGLPRLDLFEADRARRHADDREAQQYATFHLDALRLGARGFSGEGAARGLEAGKSYTLVGHPDLSGLAFVPLRIEHHASNNLGTGLAHVDARTPPDTLGEGSYRQAFEAVALGTRIAPAHHDKPLAPGTQSALVVGVPGAVLTGTRDHQVRIQFWWQRGRAPLAGGLSDAASRARPEGHAPGDEHAGTWVRVAETSAGAHHGASFVPRVGDEVLVEFAHGDIDQPVIVGQLHNGPARPPFAAGEGSGANHPGTLSGLVTQALDGGPGSHWVLDDAAGQLGHELAASLAASRLSLGYLIGRQGSRRGAYQGEGFHLASAAWTVVRAGEGLLLSATARPGARSTQMDCAESQSQLRAADATCSRLDAAAHQAGATPLAAGPAIPELLTPLDPQQDGAYAGAVNGQSATRPAPGQREGGDPVERFARPLALLESPESLVLDTPRSLAAFAGRHLAATSQRDAHLVARETIALTAGENAGLTALGGGLKAIANHGPVSLEAHTDTLQLRASQDLTITSTEDRIDVLAADKIVLQAGQSRITLDGQNLTFACPGTFTVKTGQHQWLGGEGQAAGLPVLPDGVVQLSGVITRDETTSYYPHST